MVQKVKKSKKYTLTKLAHDWREKIFESIHSDRLKHAVAVLTASGCRPSELERGVVISINDNQLRVGIRGSKVDERSGRGQPLRILMIENTTPWGKHLEQQVAINSGQPLVITYDAAGISQRLREKSREIWPRRLALVSAYSYRHYLGKSMKESGEPPEKIACTLGHASDFSQMAYGRAGGSRKIAGKHGVQRAIASIPIRHSPKLDRISRLAGTNRTLETKPKD